MIDRLRQEEDVYDNVPERNRIVFEIRDDKEFLEKYLLLEGGTDNEDELLKISQSKSSISIRNMSSAILSIRKWWKSIDKNIKDTDEFQKYIKQFFQYL